MQLLAGPGSVDGRCGDDDGDNPCSVDGCADADGCSDDDGWSDDDGSVGPIGSCDGNRSSSGSTVGTVYHK